MWTGVAVLAPLALAAVMSSGCEVPEAHAQGNCPEARILADGRCCPAGQRAKEDGVLMTCEADPNAKKAEGEKNAAPKQAKPKKARQPAVKTSEYVRLPAGSFVMGSPEGEEDSESDEGQVRVKLTHSFWLKATEVTQGEWEALMGENPSDCGYGCGKNNPVQNVSWFEAAEYMNRLSFKEGLEQCYEIKGEQVSWPKGLDCKGYRLPTEAEWEYAARAGSSGARYGALDDIAWYNDNSDSKTQVVATKRPNAVGLYDMLGNVLEWTWDAYDKQLAGGTDPIGGGLEQRDTSAVRVLRGCGWYLFARGCRAASRSGLSPGARSGRLGLRPARSDR
jgi:formylglycine-generating enzyme required for sulfatase activity